MKYPSSFWRGRSSERSRLPYLRCGVIVIDPICDKCGRDCDVPCEANLVLYKIYNEIRIGEKRILIRNLRKQLGIVDAEPDKAMRSMARRIISRVPELAFIRELDIKVGYVRSFERKTKDGREVMGDCRKVNVVYGAYLPYDFVITFYDTNVGHLSDNQLKLLMWHELKHIGVGDRGFIISPHEVEDFYSIIDEHSTRWSELGAEVADILG